MREARVGYSQRFMMFDAVDAHGFALGEFAINTLGPPAISALAALAGAWLQARSGRKIRVKVGNVEAEGRTAEEVEAALRKAVEIKERLSSGEGEE